MKESFKKKMQENKPHLTFKNTKKNTCLEKNGIFFTLTPITHLCHHINVLVLLEIGHIGIVSGAVWSATPKPSNVDNFQRFFH